GIRAGYVVGERLGVAVAIGILLPCRREQLVGNAHLDIVSLSGEHGERLVLRLPAEARDGAVILVTVGMSGDSERLALAPGRVEMAHNFAVLNRIDQPQPEQL